MSSNHDHIQFVVLVTVNSLEDTTARLIIRGDYKHWTRGPEDWGPKDPRTGDRGPEDQGPNDLALLHLAFMTEMQLVSMF